MKGNFGTKCVLSHSEDTAETRNHVVLGLLFFWGVRGKGVVCLFFNLTLCKLDLGPES